MARDKWLHIRVYESERTMLKELAGDIPVSEYVMKLVDEARAAKEKGEAKWQGKEKK